METTTQNHGPAHVLLCATANYIPNAMITIQSILERTKSPVNFHIFYNSVDRVENETVLADIIARAAAMVAKYENAGIEFINASDQERLFEGQQLSWQTGGAAGWSTYFRFLPQLLLPDADKIIYLDCDMIVNCDIREIWDIDLDGLAIAVAQYDSEGRPIPDKSQQNNRHFNAGFLVQNLKYWREHDLFGKLMAFGRGKTVQEFPSADNSLLEEYFMSPEHFDSVKILDWKYNAMPLLAVNAEKTDWDAKIMHYCGEINGNDRWKNDPVLCGGKTTRFRPWSGRNQFFKHDLWWDAARNTPFYEHFLFESFARDIIRLADISAAQKRYPKWFCNLLCLFIPNRTKRRKFRSSHTRAAIK
jgi:lipopolysaccharide biosynthesis glycosyltransferase